MSATPIRLTTLYIATLVSLALFLTVAEVITQWQIDKFQNEILQIRYTAIQRHQSQQIAKQAVQLAVATDQATFIRNRNALGRVFSELEKNYQNSRQGILMEPTCPATKALTNSDTIKQLYAQVAPNFIALQRSIRYLLTLKQPTQLNTPAAQASLATIAANEAPFLERIDAVVRQYVNELREKLGRLQQIELWLHVLTLLTLVGIAWFVFRPAANRLQQTLSQLIVAEKDTTEANRKLRSLNKSLKEARQQLYEASQRELQEQADDQRNRTSYLIAGQEAERKRLSRELHDGLGQMLTAIKMQVEGLEHKLTKGEAEPGNLAPLKHLITQTIQETRTISNNLMPSVLSDFGLVAALHLLADTQNRAAAVATSKAATVTVQIDDSLVQTSPSLHKDAEITLYRVAQESITNAIRHGKAAHINLTLAEQDNQLLLRISDDGAGFKMQRLTKEPHGQGVHNMHERIKLLNGTFTIHSTPGEGTTVSVSIPYHSQVITHDYDQVNVG